jgi:hypothetical protein
MEQLEPNTLILLEILSDSEELSNCLEGLVDLALVNDRHQLHFIKEAILDYSLKFYPNLPQYLN